MPTSKCVGFDAVIGVGKQILRGLARTFCIGTLRLKDFGLPVLRTIGVLNTRDAVARTDLSMTKTLTRLSHKRPVRQVCVLSRKPVSPDHIAESSWWVLKSSPTPVPVTAFIVERFSCSCATRAEPHRRRVTRTDCVVVVPFPTTADHSVRFKYVM